MNTKTDSPMRDLLILLSMTFALGLVAASSASHAQIGFPGEEQEAAASDGELDQSLEGTIERGKLVYDSKCTFCHRADGMGVPGAFPPLVVGAKFDADPKIVDPLVALGLYKDGAMTAGTVDVQIDVVLNGITGTRMFAFKEQISTQEVADVVTYIRNAWGNDSGELVKPEQVEAVATN